MVHSVMGNTTTKNSQRPPFWMKACQDLTKDSRMKVTELQSDEEEKRSVKSTTSDKSKNEKDSESGKQLEEERKKNNELQKELDLQISLKAEMEVAMKLLEKDIHDKQDTIISLRRQLDDIKLINLEMYKKLQECESSLKHKTELIAKLEAKTESMGSTIHQLDEKLQDDKAARKDLEETARSLGQKAATAESRAVAAEGDLRIEREWRISLQESMVRDRDKISMLTQEVESLKSIGQKYLALQEEQHVLKTQYSEAQKTLEEVGATLSENKLQLQELLEKEAAQAVADDTPTWTSDKDATACTACTKEFTIARRKHHCRRCGHIFCGACSEKTVALTGNTKPVRVCDACFAEVRLT
uniref:FYVE-type domain-containing protein n=2 Tax=Pectinophora gossypiella TaxID=13191 RepID=A0A1E1WNC0_PECGO